MDSVLLCCLWVCGVCSRACIMEIRRPVKCWGVTQKLGLMFRRGRTFNDIFLEGQALKFVLIMGDNGLFHYLCVTGMS